MKILSSILLLALASSALGATLTPLSKTHVDPDSFSGNSAGNVDSPKGSATGATFSADGLRVAAGDFKATAHYFEQAANFTLTRRFRVRHENGPFTGPNGEIGPAMFSPEGDLFATGINAKGAKVWNVATGLADPDSILETNQSQLHLTPGQTCDGANWSPDGQWFAAGAYLVLKVYARPAFNEVASFTHPGTSGHRVVELWALLFPWRPDRRRTADLAAWRLVAGRMDAGTMHARATRRAQR